MENNNFKITKQEILDNYYKKYYDKLCYSGLQGKGLNYIHSCLERYWNNENVNKILEVGAGNGEHFKYINVMKNKNVEYTALDLNPKIVEIKNEFLKYSGINFSYEVGNVEMLNFEDSLFDRTLATCLFLHLDNPLLAYQELKRVTKPGGQIAIAYPTDPGLLNRFIKNIHTMRKARKIGIENIDLIYALEHKNSVNGLLTLQKYVFSNDNIKNHYLPFRIASWNLNALIISVITISK